MNLTNKALILVASVLLLASCSSDDSAAPDRTEPKTEQTAPTIPAARQSEFGSPVTLESGVEVTVSAPKEFTPDGDDSSVEPAEHYRSFDISVVNGSDGNVDTSQIAVGLKSGGSQATIAYDPGAVDERPTGMLKPGETARFNVGFGVTDPDDMTMQIVPVPGANSIFFDL